MTYGKHLWNTSKSILKPTAAAFFRGTDPGCSEGSGDSCHGQNAHQTARGVTRCGAVRGSIVVFLEGYDWVLHADFDPLSCDIGGEQLTNIVLS